MSPVVTGSMLLALSSVLSRFLGLIRDHVFAEKFGTHLDAYFLAFRIPDLIYNLVVLGGMSAAFIPIYIRLSKKSDNEASKFACNIFFDLLFILLGLSIFLFFLCPYLLSGFPDSILLSRIMLLSPIFFGLSSVLQGIQNAKKVFMGIALAPLFYNLSIILSAFFFGDEFGQSAIAWGVVAGSFLHFCIQLPFIQKMYLKRYFLLSFKNIEVRNFIKLSLPRIFSLSVGQLGILADTTIASFLAAGSLSIFNFSSNLESLPYGVLAISFTVAIFATLSELYGNKSEFIKTIKSSINIILFFIFPAMFGLFLLRKEIVDFILQGGVFDINAANTTSFTLGIFVWASLGQSLVPLFARSFYALENTKTPLFIAIVSVFLNIITSLVLTRFFGFGVWALALSAVISNSLNALLLALFLAKKLEVKINRFFDFRKIFLMILNTLLMGIFVYFSGLLFKNSIILNIAISSTLGMFVYFAASFYFKTIPSLQLPRKNLKE